MHKFFLRSYLERTNEWTCNQASNRLLIFSVKMGFNRTLFRLALFPCGNYVVQMMPVAIKSYYRNSVIKGNPLGKLANTLGFICCFCYFFLFTTNTHFYRVIIVELELEKFQRIKSKLFFFHQIVNFSLSAIKTRLW